ncbi:5'/3'-nucleotidase sure [Podospora appendiculata]|uniref:5'/3'-nucleotidase sure n=1 Tax=Podospora appendiculata TaxID=314037 RepID=A0AAE0XAV3_9PEZI|nr:5'/3'-nucleotidase sure [Podospora appendiculata]
MRQSLLLAACLAFAPVVQGLNILITNDDGFGTSNIRELYKQLTALGHDCYIVASTSEQSDMGVQPLFTTSPHLLTDSEWGIVKAGSASIGTDPHDSHIWYYNGTPAAQVFVALDYVLPTFASFSTPDLVVSGPNSGWSVGPFLYSLSGTMGAVYAAIERDIPAVAFASGNDIPEPYFWVNSTTKVGLQDPATINARLAATFIQSLIDKAAGSRVLPEGYAVSVNLPYITSYTSDICTNPPFVIARMANNASIVDKAVYDSKTGLFSYESINIAGGNQCIGGNCNLPGETDVLSSGCKSSVTIFTVDFDPRNNAVCFNVSDVTEIVPIVVQVNGTTPPLGGLGANASVIGNPPAAATSAPPFMPTITNIGMKAQWSVSCLILGLGVGVFLL